MFKSIQTKTMFFLAAFAVSLLVITGYLIVFGIEMVCVQIKNADLQDKAVFVADIAEKELQDKNAEPEENDNIKEFLGNKSANGCFLISADGDVIGNSDKERPYDLKFGGKSSTQDIYKNKQFYVSAVSKINGQPEWFVVAEQTRTDAFPHLNLLKTIIITLITAILFFLWPMAKKISFQIQRPIKEIADSAVQIAQGDISHGIEIREEKELADIAGAFNMMLDNLKSTMKQVLDKSAEAASMHDIMEYVEETYDNLPSGIISINTLDEITTFNKTAEDLTGIKSSEMLGLNIKNPTPPGLRNLLSPMRKCLSRGSLQLKTITDIKNKNNETVPIVYSITIQFGMNNEVLGAICVFRHIEDIERFEASANRVKNLESLGEMAASLAHEIRNPLTSIRGYAQYLKSEAAESDEKNHDFEELDIILYEVDRLTAMLERFLNFARPKIPVMKEEDISRLMQYVITLMKKELPDNISIRTDFKDAPTVMVDKELFEPLLLNLILNSIQAMPDGGEIILKTYYDVKRDVVCIVVQDNGIGIPQEISDKIFDPFFTTKPDGTGMGLAIASRTVKAHNGVMEVESVENEMTRFTIMLQAVKQEADE